MNGSNNHSIDDGQFADDTPEVMGGPGWKRKRVIFSAVAIAVILLMFLTAWMSRERIAGNFIEDQLAQYDVPASYEIESISSREQVFTDIVVGDPERPDFTAETISVEIAYQLGAPQIAQIELTKPRLYGVYKNGAFSFGSLDRILSGESDAPGELPDMFVRLVDGRALIESDYGPIGVKLAGEGNVRDGFAGIVAAMAPDLEVAQCEAANTSLYGEITTKDGAPNLSGPLRSETVSCADLDLSVEGLGAILDASSNADFSQFQSNIGLETNVIRFADTIASRALGELQAAVRGETITVDHDVTLIGARTPALSSREARIDGTARLRSGMAEFEARSEISATGIRISDAYQRALGRLATADDAVPFGPLVRRFGTALRSQLDNASFTAPFVARKSGETLAIVVPEAGFMSEQGRRLFSLSQFEMRKVGDAPVRLTGNLATSGKGLPAIQGRMEDRGGESAVFRLRMAPYEAGGTRLAIPRLSITQGLRGDLAFDGSISADGDIAGMRVNGLTVPLKGRYTAEGTGFFGQECLPIRARSIAFAQAQLSQPNLSLCPGAGGAIARWSHNSLALNARVPNIMLDGRLGEQPLRLTSGLAELSGAQSINIRDFEAQYGADADLSTLSIAQVNAELGPEVRGIFSGANINFAPITFDLSDGEGNWTFADGRFEIPSSRFLVSDRADFDRFNPLEAVDGFVEFADEAFSASAMLVEPDSRREIARLSMQHDLPSGSGSADIGVTGIVFDDALQPEDLSELAKGVIALAEGTVSGTGRIDWTAEDITSSGVFSTSDFDFAAAFGPVEGVSGTINFVDLVNLTTAPDQSLRIGSVNPGVEARDGILNFALTNGQLVTVEEGRWPFMGGELILRPTQLNFAVEEDRNYVFEIVGLDAGTFVQTLELSNLSATGRFDGTLPIVFDTDGNGRIQQGLLISRMPGGNVSYVGELTYEDMGAVTNFAFDSLRSLDYTQMTVGMEGPLTGEIVTSVRFDGVSQGAGAKRNIITRQLGRLPLQFRVNVRAQFYQLLTSMKSLYDPASVRDPRELGLLQDDGTQFRPPAKRDGEPISQSKDEQSTESVIQDQESENKP